MSAWGYPPGSPFAALRAAAPLDAHWYFMKPMLLAYSRKQRRHKSRAATKKQIVGRKKFIDIEGVRLALTMTEKDYDYAFQQAYLKQKHAVKKVKKLQKLFYQYYLKNNETSLFSKK